MVAFTHLAIAVTASLLSFSGLVQSIPVFTNEPIDYSAPQNLESGGRINPRDPAPAPAPVDIAVRQTYYTAPQDLGSGGLINPRDPAPAPQFTTPVEPPIVVDSKARDAAPAPQFTNPVEPPPDSKQVCSPGLHCSSNIL